MTRRFAIDELLPHRGTMLLLHRVTDTRPGQLAGLGRFQAESAFVRDGRVDTVVTVELAAQAAAMQRALARAEEDGGAEPLRGYLVGVREATVLAPYVPAETDLVVAVTLASELSPLYHHRFRVAVGGRDVLRGTVMTYIV